MVTLVNLVTALISMSNIGYSSTYQDIILDLLNE